MRKALSLILSILMLCTMFVCLTGVTASAEEVSVPVRSLVGKRIEGFNNADWTTDVADAIKDDSNALKAPKGIGVATATSKALYTVGDVFEIEYNFVWGGYTNYYGNVEVTFGTNKIIVGNMDNRATKNYELVISNSEGTVASTLIGDDRAVIGGVYNFTYKDGKFTASVDGENIPWTVDGASAQSIEVDFDEVSATPLKLSVGGNYADTRYVKDFTMIGSANGDVNFDGVVDSTDLLASQQALLGIEGAINGAYCDNTYDDVLSSADILSMTHHILGNGLMDNYERDAVKIMAIGDSITAGAGVPAAWRYLFFEKMYTYGANFNLVGVHTSVEEPRLPDGYCGHSAVGGYTTANVVSKLDEYMAVDFDVITIMIGTNDSDKDIAASVENYRTILDRIFETNPDACVYLSSMCPKRNSNLSTWLDFGINPYIPQLVEEYAEMGYAVKYVNNVTGYDWSAADFPATDVVHPNVQGREKIADAFYNAMKDDIVALGREMPVNFTYTPNVKVTGIELSNDSLTVEVGAADTVEASVVPANANIPTILWTTSDDSVATVSNFGRITGVAEGTATITAKTLDGNFIKTVAVNVVASTAAESTPLFTDTFDNLDNWVFANSAGTISNTAKTLAIKMSNATETITSAATYAFTNGFDISFDYSASANEKVYGDKFYVGVKYAGYELRNSDCGRKLFLVDSEGTVIGTYSTVMTTEYVNARLVYNNNTLTVYYDGEAVIVVENVSIAPVNSDITITHAELWRNCYLDNFYLGTF